MRFESKHPLIAATAVACILTAVAVADGQPAKQPTERAAALKKHVGQFMLVIRYYGPKDKDKLYHSLTLRVPVVKDKRLSYWPAAQISKAQAEKIIDHLDRTGILSAAGNLNNKNFAPPKGPTYALTVTGPTHLLLYEPLGWDLKMLRRLDGLRKMLDSNAGKAMDPLLKALEPQRKKWQQSATQTKTPAKAKQSGLSQVQAKKLASVFRDRWLKENQRCTTETSDTFENFVSARQTSSGWHVVFGSSRVSQPEGIQYGQLHIYMDSKGKLEKVVREPDEVA